METPLGLNMFLVFTGTCVKCSWRKGIVGCFPGPRKPGVVASPQAGRWQPPARPTRLPAPLSSLMGFIFILSHTYIFTCVNNREQDYTLLFAN